MVRPHSEDHLVVLTFRQNHPELGTRPSKDEQESHRDVIGELAYRLKFTSLVMSTSMDVELKCGS